MAIADQFERVSHPLATLKKKDLPYSFANKAQQCKCLTNLSKTDGIVLWDKEPNLTASICGTHAFELTLSLKERFAALDSKR